MNTSYALSPETLNFISNTIITHSYKKPVLQLPKSLLSISFDLTSALRKLCPADVQFYILYDSMKKQCCTDIIGAKHVDYDVLFHFGYACFSQKIQKNHKYILPQQTTKWQSLEQNLTNKDFINQLINKNIKLLLCDQAFYKRVIKLKQLLLKQSGIEIARLPFDKQQNDNYFAFGYYVRKVEKVEPRNVLILKYETISEQQFIYPYTRLLQNLYLCSSSLQISSIYTLTPQSPLTIFSPATNKLLLQRMSQIYQLQNFTTFGILVSNPSTKFCQQKIHRCRQLLDSKKLKHFTFMMNNLNECKLGNFPQIEVYVVIACYNYSLYTSKDFYRLVVTPYDLQVAFGNSSYQKYQFDLNSLTSQSNLKQQNSQQNQSNVKQQKQKQEIMENNKNNTPKLQLTKLNNQLMLQNMIQTLDFYRQRQYKGLTFAEKKQVQKIKLGKIGIATQYRSLAQSQEKDKN